MCDVTTRTMSTGTSRSISSVRSMAFSRSRVSTVKRSISTRSTTSIPLSWPRIASTVSGATASRAIHSRPPSRTQPRSIAIPAVSFSSRSVARRRTSRPRLVIGHGGRKSGTISGEVGLRLRLVRAAASTSGHSLRRFSQARVGLSIGRGMMSAERTGSVLMRRMAPDVSPSPSRRLRSSRSDPASRIKLVYSSPPSDLASAGTLIGSQVVRSPLAGTHSRRAYCRCPPSKRIETIASLGSDVGFVARMSRVDHSPSRCWRRELVVISRAGGGGGARVGAGASSVWAAGADVGGGPGG